MTSTDTYQLKWHSHSTHMNGSVAALLRSDRFTDVVLCTMDGSQIPAHKFILSSCSVYLSNLFDGQRAVTRMGGMLYVVLPSEISTKALKTLVEYMYKGETTVSNEVLDTVLKAGEVLKIRGLWSQANEAADSTQTGFDAPSSVTPNNYMPIAQLNPKKPDVEAMQLQPKFTLKKDDKLLKALNAPTVQTPGGPRDSQKITNETKTEKTIYDFTVKDIYGVDTKLDKYKGHVCIIVNVASQCGLTDKNYKKLNKLYEKYSKTKGLKILAFPCNQFNSQEPGSANQILEFTKQNNVDFDLFEKIEVNGDSAHPLWKFLKQTQSGTFGDFIMWNFSKFIVDKNGVPMERFGPNVDPMDLVPYLNKYWPMFVGPPKLVFIKTSEAGAQATLRPGTPKATIRPAAPKGQTLLISPTQRADSPKVVPIEPKPDESGDRLPLRVLKPSREVPLVERKYGKKRKVDATDVAKQKEALKNLDGAKNPSKANSDTSEIQIKEEPDWDASSIEEEERSIAEMFHAEMTVKSEPADEVDIEEESLIYSPLACELCAEVFTQPAAWVRHVEGHAASDASARRRKHREGMDDNDESLALLRCDLCQKHFLNPAEWVRHIQSAHTETEGVQNKTCTYCKKVCPSHASMLIHMRTHTGERPFVCGLCNKGFNVRSNLMRHLRTLHDQLEESEDEVEESTPGPSEVKRES